MNFTFTADGLAAMILRRFPTSCGQDQKDLGVVLEHVWQQGLMRALVDVKEIYKETNSGGCKMLSKGDACLCFLCRVDNMLLATEQAMKTGVKP